MVPKLAGPILKQPTVDQSAIDKYTELRKFRWEEINIFQTKNYADKSVHY